MLAHTLQSTRDGLSSYVAILLTFLQTVLWKPEGLASLECAILWTDLCSYNLLGVSNHSLGAQKLGRLIFLHNLFGLFPLVPPHY
jgi:hypothetical protein